MSENERIISEDADELSEFRPQTDDLNASATDAERKQLLKQNGETHELRKKYLLRLSVFLIFLSVVSISVVAFDGFHWFGFDISDSVEIAILTSFFAQVVGLTAIAFKWLFPRD